MRLDWRDRELALIPAAVLGLGALGATLAGAFERAPADRVGRLRRIDAPGAVLVLGEQADLPWFEGAMYLGYDPGAPRLLLPCLLDPGCPPDLLEQACARRAPAHRWLLWPQPALLWGLRE